MFVRCWEYKVNHLSSISRSLWYNLRGSEQIIIMRYISQWNCIAPVRSQRKDVFVVVCQSFICKASQKFQLDGFGRQDEF